VSEACPTPATTVNACGALGASGAGGVHRARVKRSRLGEPEPGLVTTSGVAYALRSAATWAGGRFGFSSRSSAAAPATCGLAIEVPESERTSDEERW